jgi:hypothetical protein
MGYDEADIVDGSVAISVGQGAIVYGSVPISVG